mmetsp:Transcript_38993/g.70977  ORF Transcript_38993/g.70977 Transcript_38993/m.70977 type:complete len:309 (-) Transcript_38993:27-953(-)
MPSWSSGDWICPRCQQMQFRQAMHCRNCSHQKPTINTMGQAAFQYYPYAAQRTKCEGETVCPECHGVIHQSHSECMACRERRTLAANPGMASTYGTGPWNSKQAARVMPTPGPRAPAPVSNQPKTGLAALCDAYQGMDPLAILDDLAKLQEMQKKEVEEKEKAEADAKAKAEALEKMAEKAKAKAEKKQAKEAKRKEKEAAKAEAQAQADKLAEEQKTASEAKDVPTGKAAPSCSDAGSVGKAAPAAASQVEALDSDDAEAEICLAQPAGAKRSAIDAGLAEGHDEQERRRRQRERRQLRAVVVLDDG